MNMHVIGQFRDLIEDELKEGMSYHQAYLRATLRSLREINYINISTSMLAAISNNRDILQLWREEYEVINDKLTKENYPRDRKITRLNSSHVAISYAVFCLKKKASRTRRVSTQR